MVEENRASEFAAIFKRIVSPDGTMEEFVPVKIVEGYYYQEEECFIDTEQNVYPHIASLVNYGNVYGGRTSILDIINNNQDISIKDIKSELLKNVEKYRYYRSDEVDADEFGYVITRDKETNESMIFVDKDAEFYYSMYHYDSSEEEETEEFPQTKEKIETYDSIKKMYPSEIIERIKKTVKGQDEAIEKIVTILWMRYRYPELGKTNMMVVGSTGVGKTEIFRQIKKIFNVPVAIYQTTGNSQVGYVGPSITDSLAQLYHLSDGDLDVAQNGIIILDEFDKLNSNRENGEVGTIAIQNELLKIVEGSDTKIDLDMFNSVHMDTSNIVFVGCGAFADLIKDKKQEVGPIGYVTSETKENDVKVDTDDIITNAGIIPELAGRLPVVIKLRDLTAADLKDILLNSEESKFVKIINVLKEQGITVENPEVIIDGLVKRAIEKKIGARGLVGSVMPIFLKIFKAVGDNPDKYEKIVFGENITNDNSDFKLVPKRVKTKTKAMINS